MDYIIPINLPFKTNTTLFPKELQPQLWLRVKPGQLSTQQVLFCLILIAPYNAREHVQVFIACYSALTLKTDQCGMNFFTSLILRPWLCQENEVKNNKLSMRDVFPRNLDNFLLFFGLNFSLLLASWRRESLTSGARASGPLTMVPLFSVHTPCSSPTRLALNLLVSL